jgi:tryptophan synthase alpha chain
VNRVANNFFELSALSEPALMPFICGGFPGPGATAQLLPALERAGARFVEVGIPFSDPVADGPVIAAAMHEALLNGATPQSVFAEVQSIRDQSRLAIIAMVSYSIVHRMGGPVAFCAKAKSTGFDGLIVPDIPFDESADLQVECKKHDLTLSLLIAPTTPVERAVAIAKACTGFVYLLARTGITGESGGMPEVAARVQRLKEHVSIPIAVGFGISTSEHVKAVVSQGADAAIVGSALVRRMRDALANRRDPIAEAEAFTRDLSRGLLQTH